jgi:16S rRNA processing protein RimM
VRQGERQHGVAAEKLIPLGHVVNAHATRGEVRLRPFNPHSTTLRTGSAVVLRRGAAQLARHVRSVRRHKGFVLLVLDGCESRTAAEALIGYEVCVPEADLPAAGPDEIYHYQLLGMTVVTTAGTEVGVVADVLTTGGNDVCVVRADAREHLIPLVGEVVKQVDRERLRLVIEPLPGLLEE